MREFNIYMAGVGGQGIGLLADVLTRACMAAGHRVLGADTHGLAQRGGIVISHLRLGDLPCTPRVPAGEAHRLHRRADRETVEDFDLVLDRLVEAARDARELDFMNYLPRAASVDDVFDFVKTAY